MGRRKNRLKIRQKFKFGRIAKKSTSQYLGMVLVVLKFFWPYSARNVGGEAFWNFQSHILPLWQKRKKFVKNRKIRKSNKKPRGLDRSASSIAINFQQNSYLIKCDLRGSHHNGQSSQSLFWNFQLVQKDNIDFNVLHSLYRLGPKISLFSL